MNSVRDIAKLTRLPSEPKLGAAIRAWLARMGLAIWRSLEAHGHARALRELRALADRYESTRPDLARTLRDASESGDRRPALNPPMAS
jgi:hypothetical protein